VALTHFKPEDEVAVMTYAAHVNLLDDFTTDRVRTVQAIRQAASTRTNEPAHFNEAMYQAAAYLGRSGNPSSRRVIIWLTDNLPNVPFRIKEFPAHTEVEALHELHEQSVAVAPILMKNLAFLPVSGMVAAFESPWRSSYPPGDANRYAELTGGVPIQLRGKNADQRLADLIDDLRARYTVGYRPSEPKPAETFCKLRVEVASDGALRSREWNVVARQGYYRK
jgi:VWFA-related protein